MFKKWKRLLAIAMLGFIVTGCSQIRPSLDSESRRAAADYARTIPGSGYTANHYLHRIAQDYGISPPPADDSGTTQEEIKYLKELQAKRTSKDIQIISQELNFPPDYLLPERLRFVGKQSKPKTETLLKNVTEDAGAITLYLKNKFKRTRAPHLDPSLHSAFGLPGSFAYPSNHATLATVLREVLSNLVPSEKTFIENRSIQIGRNRELGGYHYPSDTDAGFSLGKRIWVELLATPEFRRDLESARLEWK